MKFSWPYLWHPDIVETQLLQIGQLIIAGVPGEFTTMAGRRLRNAVTETAATLLGGLSSNVKTVIAGLANGYTHYITTFEEYQVRRKSKNTAQYTFITCLVSQVRCNDMKALLFSTGHTLCPPI